MQFNTTTLVFSQPNYELIDCYPEEVAAFYDRIHVRCTEGLGNIIYFAAPTENNQDVASRYLDLLINAINFDKKLTIYFDITDTSGVDYGCEAENCRLILGVILKRE